MKRLDQVQELFERGLEVDPSELETFLDRACGSDTELKMEVMALVRSDRDSGGFLETPALDIEARKLAEERAGLQGTCLGDYEILEMIGEGGMGTVYRVLDLRLGEPRAIKVLPHELAEDPTCIRRFAREAKAAMGLSHPGIAKVFDVCEIEGYHFIVMELVEGNPVSELLSEGALPVEQILEIAVGLASGLAEAHSKGVTHRDIKPANVMVCRGGGVKLLDFGLSKVSRKQRSSGLFDMSTESLTLPGAVVGTIDYMSPEQILNRGIDHRCDIFAIGTLLYQMATGRLPFTGGSVPDTLDRICHRHPYPIARFSPEASDRLEVIVRRCLQKNPEDRYQSMELLLSDLKRVRAGDVVPTGEASGRQSNGSARSILYGVAAVVSLLLLLALLWKLAFD